MTESHQTPGESEQYVFISYARADQRYVDRLAAHLASSGIVTWIDRDADYGARWPRVVRERVDGCRALIVVMTPSSEESEWVEREVERALTAGKPVFPLLLAGRPHFVLGTSQYVDVTDGSMPPTDFVRQLDLAPTRGAEPRAATVSVDARPAHGATGRTRWAVVGGLALALVVAGLVWSLSTSGGRDAPDDADTLTDTLTDAADAATDSSEAVRTTAPTVTALDVVADGSIAPTCGTPSTRSLLPDLQVFLESAVAQIGDTYAFGAEASPDDPDPDSFDSSELVEWAAARAGVDLPDGSWLQYLALEESDGVVPVEQGIRTPGALLFRFSETPTPGSPRPASSHVAISLGDCRTIEAASRDDGVRVLSAEREFTHAGIIPEFADVYVSIDGALDARAIYEAARSAGFDPNQATTMTAIALAESGGKLDAVHAVDGTIGLWQIEPSGDPTRDAELRSAAFNAEQAYERSEGGETICPWEATHRPARPYVQFATTAEEAAGASGEAGFGEWSGCEGPDDRVAP